MASRRLTVSRILVGSAVVFVLALTILVVFRWRQRTPTNERDLYAAVPFRPRVIYESPNVSVTNTEAEAYLDTSLNVYIDGTLYSAQLGRIDPGVTVRCPLRSLTNERGEHFDPGRSGISEMEVRARFGGYAVHKDFPPPHE